MPRLRRNQPRGSRMPEGTAGSPADLSMLPSAPSPVSLLMPLRARQLYSQDGRGDALVRGDERFAAAYPRGAELFAGRAGARARVTRPIAAGSRTSVALKRSRF